MSRPRAADPAATARTVLVTGASSGIGRAIADRFASGGFRVYGTSRRTQPVDDRRAVEMLTLDVTSPLSVTSCVDGVLERAGRIDVLVNNAGVMHQGFAEETTFEQAGAVFDTNLFGTARVTNAVLPGMRARRRGQIINIGSLASWVGEPGEGFYAASKAALTRYTEALHHEVWALGIDVSVVEPGAFVTNVLSASSESTVTISDYDPAREAARRTLHRSMVGGDDPAEVAALVLRIAQASRPRLRYGAGGEARWLPALTTLTPQRLLHVLLRRSFGLPRRTRQ